MSKRQEIRAKRRKEQQRQQWLVIGIIAVFAVVVAAILIVPNLPKPVGEIKTPEPIARLDAKDNTMGDPNAPVKVEEFADFQCPYCGLYALQMEPDIIKQYIDTKKIYYVFHPYSFIGPESVAAAEAAYCAMDQGKFWEYHDILFVNQNGENQGNFNKTRLLAFGETIGLDMNKFKSCVDSNTYANKVQEEVSYGQSLNVTSTPSFIVNGKLVSANDLVKTIDDALAAANK